MTERTFITVYLLGRYHEMQLEGHALLDVPFCEHIPNKLVVEQAKYQYERYISECDYLHKLEIRV